MDFDWLCFSYCSIKGFYLAAIAFIIQLSESDHNCIGIVSLYYWVQASAPF